VVAAFTVPDTPVGLADVATALVDDTLYIFPPSAYEPCYYVFDMEHGAQGKWERVPPPATDDDDSALDPAELFPRLPGLRGASEFAHEWMQRRRDSESTVEQEAAIARAQYTNAVSGKQPVYGISYIAAASCVDASSVYIAGGGLITETKSNPVSYVYQLPASQRELTPLPELPTPLVYAAMTYHPEGDCLFISGGKNTKTVTTAVSKLCFRVLSQGWQTVAAMNVPRAGHGLALVLNTLYAFGGWPQHDAPTYEQTAETLTLNPGSSWGLMPDMQQGTGFMGAFAYNCEVCHDSAALAVARAHPTRWCVRCVCLQVYSLGGVAGSTLNSDPTNIIEVIPYNSTHPQSPSWVYAKRVLQAKASHAGAVVYNSIAYVVGGDQGRSASTEFVQSRSLRCPEGRTGPNCSQCLSIAGFYGPDCLPCAGVVPNGCNRPCYGHGTCNMTDGTCSCLPGYQPPNCAGCAENFVGQDCTECAPAYWGPACAPCDGLNAAGQPCNGHGACDGGGSHAGSGTCSCQDNWRGDGCENCANGFFGATCTACPGLVTGLGQACNSHGVCQGEGSTNGTGVCVCDADSPWSGPECCSYAVCVFNSWWVRLTIPLASPTDDCLLMMLAWQVQGVSRPRCWLFVWFGDGRGGGTGVGVPLPECSNEDLHRAVLAPHPHHLFVRARAVSVSGGGTESHLAALRCVALQPWCKPGVSLGCACGVQRVGSSVSTRFERHGLGHWP